MRIADFSELTLSEQLELLYKEGVYLAKRRCRDSSVILYQFLNIYVEIYYIQYRSVVSHIECNKSVDILEPYLEEIGIEQLLET